MRALFPAALLLFTFPQVAVADLHECNGTWTNKPCEAGAGKEIKERVVSSDATAPAAPVAPAAPKLTAVESTRVPTASKAKDAPAAVSAESEDAAPLPKAGVIATFGNFPLRTGTAVDSGDDSSSVIVGRLGMRGEDCEYSVTNTSKSDGYRLDLSIETVGKGETSPKKSSFSAVLSPGDSKSFKRQCRGVVSGALVLKSAARS